MKLRRVVFELTDGAINLQLYAIKSELPSDEREVVGHNFC